MTMPTIPTLSSAIAHFHFQGEGILGRLANSFKEAEADPHFSRNLFFRRRVAVALDQVSGDAGKLGDSFPHMDRHPDGPALV